MQWRKQAFFSDISPVLFIVVSMYIRKNIKREKGKTYISHALVESIRTPKGPRQNLICTLGDLSPRPREEWLKLAHKVENALVGQGDLFDKPDAEVEEIVRKVKERRAREQAAPKEPPPKPSEDDDLLAVHADLVATEPPIFHQLQHRVETHIFLCVLAYHLLVAIEKTLLDKGIHTSWATVKETLETHEVATVVLPTNGAIIIKIRKTSTPEPQHVQLYRVLEIPKQIMRPKKIVITNAQMW